MSWKKRQLVEQAFAEIGLASYAFDLSPEQFQSAVLRLDAMMATWNMSVRLGYVLTLNPDDADPDQESGLPSQANEAVYTALAIRMAPTYGKVVSRETKVAAKQANDALLTWIMATPPEMQLPRHMPAGAGYKNGRLGLPFLRPPVDLLTAGADSLLEFNGPTPAGPIS